MSKQVSALGIHVAYLLVSNIDHSFFTKSLYKEIEHFYRTFSQTITPDEIESDAKILGYRELHKKVGATHKSLVASPESLIKILLKHNTLRPINSIVDTYNYISIKNRVSIGAHDTHLINGNVELKLVAGNEVFIPLGSNNPQAVNVGEYCYVDDSNEIICRLDCRQCDKTKTSKNTESCLFIIQGHEYIPPALLTTVAEELLDIFKLGLGDQLQHKVITA